MRVTKDKAHYEYVLIYVDDLIAIFFNPEACLEEIGKKFKFKELQSTPTSYLGANLSKVQLEDGRYVWA